MKRDFTRRRMIQRPSQRIFQIDFIFTSMNDTTVRPFMYVQVYVAPCRRQFRGGLLPLARYGTHTRGTSLEA